MAIRMQKLEEDLVEESRPAPFVFGETSVIGRINGYELLSKLGRGSIGVFYCARIKGEDALVMLQVILKEELSDGASLDELSELVNRASGLRHKSIVAVADLVPISFVEGQVYVDLGVMEGDYVLVSEYAPGMMLDVWRCAFPRERVPHKTVFDLLEKMTEALDYAHNQGVTHPHLNPKSVLVAGIGAAVKIFGFWYSTRTHGPDQLGEEVQETERKTDIHLYVSPEEFAFGKLDAQSNQYSLAVMVYEMLTGDLPGGVGGQSGDAVDPVPGLTVDQNEALMVALSSNPEERFACCRDFYIAVSSRNEAVASAPVGQVGNTPVPVIVSVEPEEQTPVHEEIKDPVEPVVQSVAPVKKGNIGVIAFVGALLVVLVLIVVLFSVVLNQGKDEIAQQRNVPAPPDAPVQTPVETVTEPIKLPSETVVAPEESVVVEAPVVTEPSPVVPVVETGLVLIKSEIPAIVMMDGKKIGATAGKISGLPEGTLELVVVADGFLNHTVNVDVAAGVLVEQEVQLVATSGAIQITVLVAEEFRPFFAEVPAKLVFAEQELKLNSFTHLEEGIPVGQNKFELKHPRFSAVALIGDIERGKTTNLQFELKPKRARIRLAVNAPDAIVEIGSKNLPATRPLALPALRKMTAVVSAPGYERRNVTIPGMEPGSQKALKVVLKELRTPEENETFSLVLAPGVEMILAPIAPGSFAMGSEEGGRTEQPVHDVRIREPFWVGKTEVTQGQFEAIMGDNPSSSSGANLPVEQVGWHDAMLFCRKLTTQQLLYGSLAPGYAFTLPSEAQWEYACWAGQRDPNAFDSYWCAENSDSRPQPVGTKPANAWGLHDMCGNVWEWCLDDWHSSYKHAPSDGSRWGAGGKATRVRRGGSFLSRECYPYTRRGFSPGHASRDLGFRVVLQKK